MSLTQKIFAFFTAIHLVNKRKLREENSWIWLFTGFSLLVLVLWYDLLLWLTKFIGAVLPTTTLFIFGIMFLILLGLHTAIKISLLTDQVKNLAQKISLLEAELPENQDG